MQIALSRNTWTGSVNDRRVYESGIHLLLPWKEFIVFDKTVRSLRFDQVRLFTTDKLQVKASFRLYYQIEYVPV